MLCYVTYHFVFSSISHPVKGDRVGLVVQDHIYKLRSYESIQQDRTMFTEFEYRMYKLKEFRQIESRQKIAINLKLVKLLVFRMR